MVGGAADLQRMWPARKQLPMQRHGCRCGRTPGQTNIAASQQGTFVQRTATWGKGMIVLRKHAPDPPATVAHRGSRACSASDDLPLPVVSLVALVVLLLADLWWTGCTGSTGIKSCTSGVTVDSDWDSDIFAGPRT